MKGFCSTPGHQDRAARLYPGGWRCVWCKPAPFADRRKSAGDADAAPVSHAQARHHRDVLDEATRGAA